MRRVEQFYQKEKAELSPICVAVGQAVRLGARKVLEYHKVSPEALKTYYKGDKTPVTVADEESERVIIDSIKRVLPTARIFSEETGIREGADTAKTVYIDPLDGTNPFTHGESYSSVGVAVRENGITTVAAICLPFKRELLLAEKGKGAWRYALDENMSITAKPEKISVSPKMTVGKSNIYVDANFFPANRAAKLAFLDRLSQLSPSEPLSLRMICSNISQQAEVAMGHGDATLTDCVGGPFDLFAGELMITEAGGKFSDLDGQPISEQTQVALGSNGALHAILLPMLKEVYKDYKGFRS